MADETGEGDFGWSGRGGADQDAFFAMEGLQATLQQLEGRLRQQDVSEASSTEYCDNFCEVLMQYAGSRNSVEHGLSLLEVYCLSINCFAAARPHLTGESPSVALVLKRLALSCFELLLSVPQNEIPFEAWLQFHGSVQAAHEAVMQYGSTDLQTLLHITGEGGAWNSPALVALLTRQPTDAHEVNEYLALEGEDFLEMRIKHLEKVGEVEKALILTKACGGCSLLPSQANFHQTFVTQLCQLLPSEEAIAEISKLDAKDVLDIICNMETDGDENTAFILCTTFLTQQLQREDLQCSWELTLIWSKLQRRIDGSLESFMERCLQFGAIAKTVYHLLFLIRVIQTETVHFGLAVSVELCVKAFQLPRQQDVETKTTVCKTVACLLPHDLEVLRACQLTEFLLSPSQEVFDCLEDLYRRPDQKYDEENAIIPNSLRCELLLALKGHWPFDPEFWDWKTLKHYCVKVLGRDPEEEEGSAAELVTTAPLNTEEEEKAVNAQEEGRPDEGSLAELNKDERGGEPAGASQQKKTLKKAVWTSERARRWQQYKFLCQICQREVIEPRFLHHARKHAVSDVWTCPVCLLKFESRQDFVPHTKKHLRMPARVCHLKKKKVKKKKDVGKNQPDLQLDRDEEEANDLEPGQVPLDPSLVMYYQSSRDPVVLQHILEQAATVPKKPSDDDYITFDYISTHYKLQDREVYHCPATDCSKNFKLFKYLGVHLKNDHDDSDPNVRHYMEMRDRREKCTFCRRTFMSAYHHRRHRRAHYGERPYTCVVAGCGERFATTNQLIEHKHQHGFRLSYHCELRGCSLSFCDLGQLYHHEAQHFRDAAYTCTSPGCRKFYYSRKEFLKHLATHDITFTEKEFEAQRKAKRKLFLPDVGDDVRPEVVHRSDEGLSNEPPQHLEREESKVCLAQVAVCFDGKTFTCGLDKCGRSFTKARDIQKHLKIVHPDQFKEEKSSCKMRDKRLKTRFLKEQRSTGEVSTSVGSLQERDLLPAADAAACDTTISLNSSTRPCKVEICTALSEIVEGFSQLSLTSATPTLPRTPRRQAVGARGQRPTPPTAAPPKATPSKIELRSHLPKKLAWERDSAQDVDTPLACVPQKGPSVDQTQTEGGTVVLHTDRPYVCDVESCFFESVTSRALVHHYFRKHGYSKKDVGQMEIFNSLKFKPFKCHLCSKVYRERKVLKSHCLHKHNASDIVVENIKFHVKTKADDTLPSAKQALLQPKDREASSSTKMVHAENRNKPSWKHRAPNRDHRAKMVKTQDQKLRRCVPPASHQGPCPLRTTRGRRASQRLVRKEIQCLEDKAYLCVHKGCHAGFMKQWNLLRHLQDVHHYNSSQFYWEEDGNLHPCKHSSCKKKFYQLSSLYKHYRSDHQSSEEPIPRFKCSYGNCSASYHLKSSLLRHTREVHEGEESVEATPLPPPQCNGSYKKPVFYRRCEQTEVRLVRLQSARRRDGTGAGCQKKLLLTSASPPLKTSERLALKQSSKSHNEGNGASQSADKFEAVGEAPDEERDVKRVKPKPRKMRGEFVLRTPEEALQMCQDRCLRVAFPCMIQDCESVVSQLRSLRRHYLQCHKMQRTRLAQNEDKLYYTAEQLEELIQQKSAVPELARVPNGVLKMEYQAEPENPGGPPLPMSLHSIKMEAEGQEVLEFSGEPHADSAVLIGADDVLYGESNGHAEQITEKESPSLEAHTKGESPAPPLDLSPPSTLRITGIDAPLEPSERESKPASVPPGACTPTSLGPTRQPLRWRNSEISEPLPAPPHPPAQKDVLSPTLAPRAFDLAGYKPSGFESSFLKFIQEKEENHKRDKLCSVGVLNACYKPDAPRRRDCYRRNGSVKENNQRGPTRSRRSRSSLLKPLLSTDECSSIQNLRFILERALTGCGDQAIKQLQFLKPVVVLERPKSSASLLDLLPPETKAEA